MKLMWPRLNRDPLKPIIWLQKKKGRVMGRKRNQEEVYRSLTRHKEEEPALLLVCGGDLMALYVILSAEG